MKYRGILYAWSPPSAKDSSATSTKAFTGDKRDRDRTVHLDLYYWWEFEPKATPERTPKFFDLITALVNIEDSRKLFGECCEFLRQR